ncbi:MAG TPA: HAD hydrolase-like protein [Humisphaera sp.]
MRYRLAAFDFDGTLADSFGWFVGILNEVAETFSFRRLGPADVEHVRGLEGRPLLKYLGLPLWKLPRVASHVRALQSRDIGVIKLFPGVPEMLRGLHTAGVTVAVVSSNAEPNIRQVLGPELSGLVRHFGCGASMFGKRSKLVAACRAVGVRPAEAIYVGDEGRDVEAAARAGMASGAVAWGYAPLETLVARRPTMTFAEPAEVIRRVTA